MKIKVARPSKTKAAAATATDSSITATTATATSSRPPPAAVVGPPAVVALYTFPKRQMPKLCFQLILVMFLWYFYLNQTILQQPQQKMIQGKVQTTTATATKESNNDNNNNNNNLNQEPIERFSSLYVSSSSLVSFANVSSVLPSPPPPSIETVTDIREWNMDTFQAMLSLNNDNNNNNNNAKQQQQQLLQGTLINISDAGMIGTIKNNQLVVNVNHKYTFWQQGQKRLCHLLRAMILPRTQLLQQQQQQQGLQSNMNHHDTFNSNDSSPSSSLLSSFFLLNMTINCTKIVQNENLGQGNWITAIYAVRFAAAAAQVDHQFQCTDGRQSQMKLLLPWFDGYHRHPYHHNDASSVTAGTMTTMSTDTTISSSPQSSFWPYHPDTQKNDEDIPSMMKMACIEDYSKLRIDKMANLIIDDIRRMAVTLVGTQNDDIRQHPSIPKDQPPLIPNVVLDDVVIHFRCGDVMGGARRNDFGMINFHEYSNWIVPNTTQSIGIVTQPFESIYNRGKDARKVQGCYNATMALVQTLHKTFVSSSSSSIRITIHNDGITETLPLAYARIAMAKQSFTSLSSFGIFPVIGTFGDGYFQKGNRGVNPFANYLPEYYPNLHMMNGKKLTTGQMHKMKVNEIIDWLTTTETTTTTTTTSPHLDPLSP